MAALPRGTSTSRFLRTCTLLPVKPTNCSKSFLRPKHPLLRIRVRHTNLQPAIVALGNVSSGILGGPRAHDCKHHENGRLLRLPGMEFNFSKIGTILDRIKTPLTLGE